MNRHLASFCLCWTISLIAARASGVTIAWSPVGNAGNAADPLDGDLVTPGLQNFGAVPYAYRIGTYDVTSSQYAEFLNAKDPSGTNVLGLWNSAMADAGNGSITFNGGNPTGSKYVPIAGHENHPVNFVGWYQAIRFANWLNNGQGNGDTETGAYTLGPLGAGGIPKNGNSITRNPGAKVFLPSENEWYKAAYYNPATSSYFQYPTSSNKAPIAEAPPGGSNSANCNFAVGLNNLTDVGAYTGTTSPYGAYDMGGNVFQWNEALIGGGDRGLRGGAFALNSDGMLYDSRWNFVAVDLYNDLGFRVASIATVPEPSGLMLAALGIFALGWNTARFRNIQSGGKQSRLGKGLVLLAATALWGAQTQLCNADSAVAWCSDSGPAQWPIADSQLS